jgi:hypothetical protein
VAYDSVRVVDDFVSAISGFDEPIGQFDSFVARSPGEIFVESRLREKYIPIERRVPLDVQAEGERFVTEVVPPLQPIVYVLCSWQYLSSSGNDVVFLMGTKVLRNEILARNCIVVEKHE